MSTQVAAQHQSGNYDSNPWRSSDRTTLRKSISADNGPSLLVRKQQAPPALAGPPQALAGVSQGRVGNGRRKARRKHSLGSTDGTDFHLNMAQQMQNLQLSGSTRSCSPASPNVAKRLYRNLSNKLKGSHSSFDDICQTTKCEGQQPRGAALDVQCNEALFEAVGHQDIQAVWLLLNRCSADELDINTPNSQGLTPLDVALMTNNGPMARCLLRAGALQSPHCVGAEGSECRVEGLVREASERVRALRSLPLTEADGAHTEAQRQLTAWEWRCRLYTSMKSAFDLASVPDPPGNVRLSVTSSDSLTVSFEEPQGAASAVVTGYKVEWSPLQDFSAQCGEMTVEPDRGCCNITNLRTGEVQYVRVCAANIKGWGLPQTASPRGAIPSNWRQVDGRRPRLQGQIQLLEHLLQQERARQHLYSYTENAKLQNSSRKQTMSRSLKHLFHSSTKSVKTLKSGVYIAAVFHHKDHVLVTGEEQLPLVEVDGAQSGCSAHEFLWFSKLSCAWEEVDWLRQNISASTSSSTALHARHRLLTAAAQLQALLGSQQLGRVHYEPIKDRDGNVLLVTVREVDASSTWAGGRWMPIARFQSHRKSLSNPEQPTALDILLITLQDVLCYQRRSELCLSPGLYLAYLKVSSSVDQIKVQVPARQPNVLCHVKVRDTANVSREEWEWLQRTACDGSEAAPGDYTHAHAPLFCTELQAALKALLRQLNLSLHQADGFRVYTQEVLELGAGVSLLLVLPPCAAVCTAPGQGTPYPPHSTCLRLPLQMFELAHFHTYQEEFMGLYGRVSALMEVSSLLVQQAQREAISDAELRSAKRRANEVSLSLQQLDALWRDMRWMLDVLTYARYKQRSGSLPISRLLAPCEGGPRQHDVLCPHPDLLPSPTPSPENLHWRTESGGPRASDDDSGSDVFLPADSDDDSGDDDSTRDPAVPALSLPGPSACVPHILRPRERGPLYRQHRCRQPQRVAPGPGLSTPTAGPATDTGPDLDPCSSPPSGPGSAGSQAGDSGPWPELQPGSPPGPDSISSVL